MSISDPIHFTTNQHFYAFTKAEKFNDMYLHLEDALGESLDGLVPVPRGALGKRAEDIRQEDAGLALGQHVHTQVLRVPVVQRTLCHLGKEKIADK